MSRTPPRPLHRDDSPATPRYTTTPGIKPPTRTTRCAISTAHMPAEALRRAQRKITTYSWSTSR
jgi:hypothetical protein